MRAASHAAESSACNLRPNPKNPNCYSLTLWKPCFFAAFATLGYHPSGDLLDRLGHHAAGIIRTFRPQATSNALWAFAKLAYVPCEPFLAAASLQVRCPPPLAPVPSSKPDHPKPRSYIHYVLGLQCGDSSHPFLAPRSCPAQDTKRLPWRSGLIFECATFRGRSGTS